MNARSLVNKSAEFQSLAADLDIIAVTETWLKPHILDCEILPGLDFSIHRRDRKDKTGGGVMLAVKNSIQTLRRKDLEGDAEIVLCELRPEARRKILAVVFYRPPNSNLDHLKELKKSLRHASQFNFDQIIICGDFNLPDIDWSTGIQGRNLRGVWGVGGGGGCDTPQSTNHLDWQGKSFGLAGQ